MNKISFAILCNYVQLVATTFCLLLFPLISSYNWYQELVCYHELYPIISPYAWWKKLQSLVCANESFV